MTTESDGWDANYSVVGAQRARGGPAARACDHPPSCPADCSSSARPARSGRRRSKSSPATPELELVGLSAERSSDALIGQAQRFGVDRIALADADAGCARGRPVDTFATTLVRGGTDLVIVAELLGHARLETTRGYTRPSAEDRTRALDLFLVDQ